MVAPEDDGEDMPSGGSEMKTDTLVQPARRWTAAELRKLPPNQRDAIMEAAAALAEGEYRNNADLTAFEAFGKDDLHGDSSSTETRNNKKKAAPPGNQRQQVQQKRDERC